MITALALALFFVGQEPTPPPPPTPSTPAAVSQAETEVSTILDRLHAMAAAADGPAYFALFTPDARFIGTDATERWSLGELRAYAEPYFSRGQGWTYRPRDRVVSFAPDGGTAWFDELLDHDRYGEVRGSGVLVRTPEGWRVAQYVLSFPVPNDAAEDVVARIRSGPPPQTPPFE